MASENAKRDDNRNVVLLGVTDDSDQEIRQLAVDPVTGRLKVSASVSADIDFDDLSDVEVASAGTGSIIYFDGSDWVDLPAGTANYILKTKGTGAAPEWGVGGGDVLGPTSSVDGEMVLFDSTTGKLIKRATGSGLVRATSGVYGTSTVAEADIDSKAVTLTKIQDISSKEILGRDTAGDGSVERLGTATIRGILNVEDGANAYSHPNHSGDVTSVGDGATTIANDAVTNAKAANMAQNTIKGRITASTGDPEDLSAANVRTIINVADGADVGDVLAPATNTNNYIPQWNGADSKTLKDGLATTTFLRQSVNGELAALDAKTTPVDADVVMIDDSAASNAKKKLSWSNIKATLKTYFDTLYNNYVHPNHTGDVTSVGDGATTIASSAVTNAKMANMTTKTYKGRTAGTTGAPEDVAVATLKSDLNLVKGDVGLDNVTNDAQIAKAIGTTKGDIIVFTGSGTPVRIGVGSNDQVLTADSGELSGVKWSAAGGVSTFTGLDDTPANYTDAGGKVLAVNSTPNAIEFLSVTGTGDVVKATSPTLITPALGTPASGTLTNATGLPLTGLVNDTTTALGVGSIELGHATDTTLARVATGRASIEGLGVVRGPSSPTDEHIAIFDGTTGDLIKSAGKGVPAGDIVGTTDTQTLTNKTLTDPKIHTAINAQTGTTYTLVLTDDNKTVTMNNASANTLTVPTNASVAFTVGTKVLVFQIGEGSTTIAAAGGVTINKPTGLALEIAEQHGSRALLKTATDTWQMI